MAPPVPPAAPGPIHQLHGFPGGGLGDLFFLFGPEIAVAVAVVVIVVLVVAVTRGDPERRGRLLPLVYYYLATTVGLVLVLVGVIMGLHGAVQAALPRTGGDFSYSEPPYDAQGNPVKESKAQKAEREADALKTSRASGVATGIDGGITALVGAPVFFWHLRQARRKEPDWLGAPRGSAAD